MKTTVDLPDSLFEAAKAWADGRGVTFRQLVEDGLRLVLEQGQQPDTPFQLRDGSFKGDGLQQNRSWTELRQTIYEGRGE